MTLSPRAALSFSRERAKARTWSPAASAAFTVAEPTPPDAPTTATIMSSNLPSEGTTVFSEGAVATSVFSEGAVATSNSLSFETIGLKSAGEKVVDARYPPLVERDPCPVHPVQLYIIFREV